MPAIAPADVFAAQDHDAMVKISSDLVSIPSPTGQEAAIGEYIATRFGELGMDVELQEVEEGRNNVIARLEGAGSGPTLMLLAHMDVNTHPEMDVRAPFGAESLPPGYLAKATLQDGWIFGNGISNMKCAFAGFYTALRMLRDSGVRLAGDVVMAGVIGEIEKAPVDDWQGPAYRGGGLGARFMVHHGVTADFCINGEPTALRLQTGNAGYVFARLNIRGNLQPTYSRSYADDPIDRAYELIRALRAWEAEYQRRHPHPLMKPLINIGAIYGGYPFKPSLTPSFCNVYVHVNLIPGQSILGVKRELEEVLAGLSTADRPLDASVELYLASNGHEIDVNHPGAQAVAAGYREVFGKEVPRPNPERYSVSSDNSVLADFGIPGVTFGAGGINRAGGFSGYEPGIGPVGIKIENLAACSRVYAAAAMQYCGVA